MNRAELTVYLLHNRHFTTLLFQGGQRPLQEEGGRVPSDQREVAVAARGGPFAPQSLRLQRQQQRLLARQSQRSSISCTARQEYVECRSGHSPDAVEKAVCPPITRGEFNMHLQKIETYGSSGESNLNLPFGF